MHLLHHHRFIAGLITASSVIMVLAMLLLTSICVQARAIRDTYQDDISGVDIAESVEETDAEPGLKKLA